RGARHPDRHRHVPPVPRPPPVARAARAPPGGAVVTRETAAAEVDEPLGERDALLTAYLDDELGPAERTRFEAMMADDPALAADVAAYRVMADLASSAVALEPTDRELRRFWSRFYNRAEWRTGWSLILVGLVALALVGCYELIRLHVSWIVKAAVLSILI